MVDTDRKLFGERENKIDGEIVNVVREEKRWRKRGYWPEEFEKKGAKGGESEGEDEESRVGRMPSSDEEDMGDQGNNEDAGS